MEIKLKLPIPYSKYELGFQYSKFTPLTEFESLIIILVFCKNKNEIGRLENFSKVIMEKYNLNEKFLNLFEESFKKLKKSQTIITEGNDRFYDILIGNININKDVEVNISKEVFVGVKEETIIKKFTYISNLLIKNGIKLEKSFNNVDIGNKDLSFFIEINKKINSNYDREFDLKADEIKNEGQEAYIEKKFLNDLDSIPRFSNIYFRNEEVIFKHEESRLYPTDQASEEIIALFSNQEFYSELPKMIIENIESKIKAPITAKDFQTIDSKNVNEKLLFEINEGLFSIIDNKIIGLFNRKKELFFDNIANSNSNFYNELCIENFSNYIPIITEILNNENKNVLNKIYINVNEEIKKIIIDSLFKDKSILKNNIAFIEEFQKDCMPMLKMLRLHDLLDLAMTDKLFLEIIRSDSNDRKYVGELQTNNISEIIHKDIINIYHFEYTGQNYYFKNSSIEMEVNNFYKEFNLLKIDNLENLKIFQLKLKQWKEINSKISFTIILLEQKLQSSIKELELQKEKAIKDSCELMAVEIRKVVEPFFQYLGITDISKLSDEHINDYEKLGDFKDKWRWNHSYLHNDKRTNYSRESLSKLENNKLFFEKIIKEIKEERN